MTFLFLSIHITICYLIFILIIIIYKKIYNFSFSITPIFYFFEGGGNSILGIFIFKIFFSGNFFLELFLFIIYYLIYNILFYILQHGLYHILFTLNLISYLMPYLNHLSAQSAFALSYTLIFIVSNSLPL